VHNRQSYAFAEFTFDGDVLYKGATWIPLAPKEAKFLRVLIEANGEVVTLAQLLEQIWPNQKTGPESITRCVSTLRKKLDSRKPIVATVPHRGYRFAAQLEAPVVAAEPPTLASTSQTNPAALRTLFLAREASVRRSRSSYFESRRLMYEAANLDPKSDLVWTNIAQLHITLAMSSFLDAKVAAARAKDAAELALTLNPGNYEALAAKAFCEVVVDGDAHALAALAQAAKAVPDSPPILNYYGWALASLGNLEQALLVYGKLIDIPGVGQGDQLNYGYLQFCQGNTVSALRYLYKARENAPEFGPLHGMIALVEAWNGDVEASRSSIARALELSPQNPNMLSIDAYVKAKSGDHLGAQRRITELRVNGEFLCSAGFLAPAIGLVESSEQVQEALEYSESAGEVFRRIILRDPRMADFLGARANFA
jgi:DNA-binding winged helix-turn-helix (wHTH) protein/Tfp pilus assembly protein PilF